MFKTKKPILGSEDWVSKNSPSKRRSSSAGSVQKVGKKKVAGPLKLVEFKNKD